MFQYQPSKLKIKKKVDFNPNFKFISSVAEYNKVSFYNKIQNTNTNKIFLISYLNTNYYCRILGTILLNMLNVKSKREQKIKFKE